jgi:hypothetical protein
MMIALIRREAAPKRFSSISETVYTPSLLRRLDIKMPRAMTPIPIQKTSHIPEMP